MNKRGQMKLSFGMMFSIILIIIFLIFGFYVIKTFIRTQNTILVAQFYDNLNKDLESSWKSTRVDMEVEYRLPKKIIYVKINSDEDDNIVLYEKERILGKGTIKHYTLGNSNDLKIYVHEGKIRFKLIKEFGENVVKIAKIE